jgi:small subunit ribosomal protein S14
MKYILLKDRRRRILHFLFERRRNVLRAIVENINLTPRLRGQAYRALLQRPRDSSSTRRRNRCIMTNRPRAIVRRFGISRLIFRKLALDGILVGVKKAS